MVFPWEHTIYRCVPLFQAIVSVNGNQPVKQEHWLIQVLQMVEAGQTFISKSPFLAIMVEGDLEMAVDFKDNLEIHVDLHGTSSMQSQTLYPNE